MQLAQAIKQRRAKQGAVLSPFSSTPMPIAVEVAMPAPEQAMMPINGGWYGAQTTAQWNVVPQGMVKKRFFGLPSSISRGDFAFCRRSGGPVKCLSKWFVVVFLIIDGLTLS